METKQAILQNTECQSLFKFFTKVFHKICGDCATSSSISISDGQISNLARSKCDCMCDILRQSDCTSQQLAAIHHYQSHQTSHYREQ